MTVEILERFIVNEITQGTLPPYWDDKEVVQGLIKSINAVFQKYIDTVYDMTNGITISNAMGKNLDDIGYKYNIARQGMTDDEYRLAILLKMAAYSDSGTTTDVIRFVRSSFLASFADITQYPETRFGFMRVEGAVITEDRASNINSKVTSGGRLDITWDYEGQSFVPCCLVPSAPVQDLLAVIPAGTTDTIGITLDAGMFDTLGYLTEDLKTIYPAGLERSDLSLNGQGMTTVLDSDGNPIELITDDGPVPLEVLLDTSIGGRYLACLPVTRP